MKKISFLFTIASLVGTFTLTAQIPEKAEDISPLLIGEVIPDATLMAVDGAEYSILNIIKNKPSVLMFYRGGWCPYCNAHLAELQSIEKEIIELGYQIVAISPDSPENLRVSVEKEKLNYKIYSYGDESLIEKMGIAFQAPDRYLSRLDNISGGVNTGFLPVPSVFVVDTTGLILFEYINPNYRTRIGAGLLLAVIKELKMKDE